MKKLLVLTIGLLFIIGCSPGKKELYEKTDAFVQSLSTTYNSYGVLGGSSYSKKTSDNRYRITPIGRLISVEILKDASKDDYEDLREDLEEHYDGDRRVNSVYISQGGTVIIDCRN